MNVLFLYNHPHHAAPFLRSLPHFSSQGVEIHAQPIADDEVWNVSEATDYDVIFLQEPPVHEEVLACGKPVILLERIDGAQLRAARKYLPQVAGVVKGYIYHNRHLNNTAFDRAHVEILHRTGVTGSNPRHRDERPIPQIHTRNLAKVFAGYGFGAHANMGRLVQTVVDFDAPRPIDVSFHGIVNYGGSEIETHRKAALNVVKTWSDKVAYGAGRPLNAENYYLTLLRSKVVLSPWGWGEACHRDYEAMLLGAVVIKPDTSHVECWPNVFQPDVQAYLPCASDWSDAPDIIRNVVDNWEAFRSQREHARKLCCIAWRPELIAQRLIWAIHKVLRYAHARTN